MPRRLSAYPDNRKRNIRRLPTQREQDLPTEPGRYWWTEWKALVDVVKLPRRAGLWVTPPGAASVPIKITTMIAGRFIKDTASC